MAKWSQYEIDKARARLLELAPKGTHIFGIVRHVAPSGMSRVIDLLTIQPAEDQDGYDKGVTIRALAYNAARVLGMSYSDKHEGLTVKGCGMDMLFYTVNRLGEILYDDGNAFTYRRL